VKHNGVMIERERERERIMFEVKSPCSCSCGSCSQNWNRYFRGNQGEHVYDCNHVREYLMLVRQNQRIQEKPDLGTKTG
jgi:hypothetical protein